MMILSLRTDVTHLCELLAIHSLPGAKALDIGRITRSHYLFLGAEEGSISEASRQNYLFLLFREPHEAVTILLGCRGLWYNRCWRRMQTVAQLIALLCPRDA